MKTRILALAALLLTLSSRVARADLAPEPQVFDYQNHSSTSLIVAGSAIAAGVVIAGLLFARSRRVAAAQGDVMPVANDAVKAK